jgi:hypothetical protein
MRRSRKAGATNAGAALSGVLMMGLGGCAGEPAEPVPGRSSQALSARPRVSVPDFDFEGQDRSCRLAGTCAPRITLTPELTPHRHKQDSVRPPAHDPNKPRFVFAALGDSYGAGEGAPEEAGDFDEHGDLTGSQEKWGDGLPSGLSDTEVLTWLGNLAEWRNETTIGDPPHTLLGERDLLARQARACHRSDVAGSHVARGLLQDRWGDDVEIVHMSFACSGAEVDQLIDDTDGGHAGCAEEYPDSRDDLMGCFGQTDEIGGRDRALPQLRQLRDFEAALGQKVDALYVSVGGNDMSFSNIVGKCLPQNFLQCAHIPAMVWAGPLAAVPVAVAVEWLSDQTACTNSPPAGEVEACVNAEDPDLRDYSPMGGHECGKQRVVGQYERLAVALREHGIEDVHISSYPNPLLDERGQPFTSEACHAVDERSFGCAREEVRSTLALDVIPALNDVVREAASDHGWTLVDTADRMVGHGLCSTAPYINGTEQATRNQGKDMYLPPPVGLLSLMLSTGSIHPNVAGHRHVYGESIARSLESSVERVMRPEKPTDLRAGPTVAGGDIEVLWKDVSDHEHQYELEITEAGSSRRVTLPRNSQKYRIALGHPASLEVGIKTCFGTRTRVCSQPAYVSVSNIVPTSPPQLVVSGTVVSWEAPPRQPAGAVQFYVLELERGAAIERSIAREQVFSFMDEALTAVRVYACNPAGCGPGAVHEMTGPVFCSEHPGAAGCISDFPR